MWSYLHPWVLNFRHTPTPSRRILQTHRRQTQDTFIQTAESSVCVWSAVPLDSSTSDVTRMVKGKSAGMTGLKAFSASAPNVTHTADIAEVQRRNSWGSYAGNTLTVTELPAVHSSHPPDLIGGIWRKLKENAQWMSCTSQPEINMRLKHSLTS